MRILLPIIFLTTFLIGIMLLIDVSLEKNEEKECYKWQRDAGHYQGYYLLEWQKAQCDTFGIPIDAEVK